MVSALDSGSSSPERASEEKSVVSSIVSLRSKSSHKSGNDPVAVKAKAAAAQAYARNQREIAMEKRLKVRQSNKGNC